MSDQKILQMKILSAAKVGNVTEMCTLIERGANPFILDHDGKSPISYACDLINPVQTKVLAKGVVRFLYTSKM